MKNTGAKGIPVKEETKKLLRRWMHDHNMTVYDQAINELLKKVGDKNQ